MTAKALNEKEILRAVGEACNRLPDCSPTLASAYEEGGKDGVARAWAVAISNFEEDLITELRKVTPEFAECLRTAMKQRRGVM